MSAIFALANQKGGVAKATTTGHPDGRSEKAGFQRADDRLRPAGQPVDVGSCRKSGQRNHVRGHEGHGLGAGGHPAHTQLRYHSGEHHPCRH